MIIHILVIVIYIFVDTFAYIPYNCPNSNQSLEVVLLMLEKVRS